MQCLNFIRCDFSFIFIHVDRVTYLSDSMRHLGKLGSGRSDRVTFGKHSTYSRTNPRYQLRLHSFEQLHSTAGVGSSALLRDTESNVSNVSAHSFASHASFESHTSHTSHTSVLSRGSLGALLTTRPPPAPAMFRGGLATGGSLFSNSSTDSSLLPRREPVASNPLHSEDARAANELETIGSWTGSAGFSHFSVPAAASSSLLATCGAFVVHQQLPLSLAQVTFQPITEAATITTATSDNAHSPTLVAANNPLTRVPVAMLAANASNDALLPDAESAHLNSFYKPNISGPSSQSAFRPIAVRPVLPPFSFSGGPSTLQFSPPAPVSSLKMSAELSPASSIDSRVSHEPTPARLSNLLLLSSQPPDAAVSVPDATSSGGAATQPSQVQSQTQTRSSAAAVPDAPPAGGVSGSGLLAPAPPSLLLGTQGAGAAAPQEQTSARSVLDTMENSSRTSSVTLSPFLGAQSGGDSHRAPSSELVSPF